MKLGNKRKMNHKLLTVILAVAIIISSVPVSYLTGNTDTADAATRGKLEQTNLTGYRLKSTKYMQIILADYQNRNTRIGSCTDGGMQMHKFEIGDNLVFCMEHGVVQKEVTLRAENRNDSKFAGAYNNDGYSYAIDNMFKVLFYGPVTGSTISELTKDLGFADSIYYGKNGEPTLASWIAATQMLVWESQQLMRDENFKKVQNDLYYQTTWRGPTTTPISINHYSNNITGTPAMDIYNFMAGKIKENGKFDRAIASKNEDKPKKITVPGDVTFPYTVSFSAGSNAGNYKLYNDKDVEIKDAAIEYDEGAKEYRLTIKNSSALDKTLKIKHYDGAAKRADRYLTGAHGKDYRQYFWEYETTSGHTQGFVSGLYNPTEGYLKLTQSNNIKPEPGSCNPPDVEVFPTLYMPIEKIDANGGFDNNQNTPMGDAGLDAVYTLERSINNGNWEIIDSVTLDDYGSEHTFQDQPFLSAEELKPYLAESGSISNCDHPITDEEGNVTGYEHNGSKKPTSRSWKTEVSYRITESRPDGRYVDPDPYEGVREYNFTYEALTSDTCTAWCHEDPWTDVEYTFGWVTTKGAGGAYSEQGESPADELRYDKETFVNDIFRGDIQIIKSNEKENPFKDADLGGSSISRNSYWTIRLESKGFENSEYIHLISDTPKVVSGGINQYTASRDSGIPNNALTGGGMKIGTSGTLIIKDVPYGTYIVTEISADDPKYVLEQFKVVVDEHKESSGERVNETGGFGGYAVTGTNSIGSLAAGTGDYYNNRYDVNIRDKIKSNVVKVEKVDSETGKRIPLKGTQVYIRYKGNPDYTHEQNRRMFGETGTVAKNIYNRFLPNAESINSPSTNYTFKLDENGELTIPYRIPYGRYEILEWLLPEGYYVGKYDETGRGSSHDFGIIEEGDFCLTDLDEDGSFEATVAIYDKEGNRVSFQDKDKYSFGELENMITNEYTFEVKEQNMHVDGNFSQLVTFEGNISDADPTYDKGDNPYVNYYRSAAVINNAAKGKIRIEKTGEKFVGFEKQQKGGKTIFATVFEGAAKIKNAVFGIFAAKDENLNDGSEGPDIYDSTTDEKIEIPESKSSHFSNITENIKAFFGKLVNPKEYQAAKYEIGSTSHKSGAELWYMREREAAEDNIKRTIYVTPEQKDTTYSYAYETADDKYKYRWDVETVMKHQAGGRNVTEVNVTKTTSAIGGFVPDIPMTEMTGSVGGTLLEPIQNYMPITDPDAPESWNSTSKLEAYSKTYLFEAEGKVLNYADGTEFKDELYIYDDEEEVDLSKHCPARYALKDYVYYTLTADDLKPEERVVGYEQILVSPGTDVNGDGDFDDLDEGDVPPEYETEEVKATKTAFEWENEGYILTGEPEAGDIAILKNENPDNENPDADDSYKTAVKGYYIGREYTEMSEDYTLIDADETGKPLPEYILPDGWIVLPPSDEIQDEPKHVIIYKADESGESIESSESGESGESDESDENISYRVLLDDKTTWQPSTEDGNFVKAAVQVYQIKYTQEKGDPDGFTVNFDGFSLGAGVDRESGVATTLITKQTTNPANEKIGVGLGFEYDNAPEQVTFRTVPIEAPIYFAWADNIKADMYYKGGVAYAAISMPQSAVDYLYEEITPTLNFIHRDASENEESLYLDWYSKLSPENSEAEFNTRDGLPDGVTVKVRRVDSADNRSETMYYLEIMTSRMEDNPVKITFADGYTMDIYCAEVLSGNCVGIIDLYNVYKTTRYTKSELIEMITTDERGIAESSLLPLGKYIVRELKAPDGYVTSDKEHVVELKYKDQFTPLIWQTVSSTNDYVPVEIDISKVFETAYESGEYISSGGATFGIYSGDNLIDVITIRADGIAKSTVKLPYGTYYIKELSTLPSHIKDDRPYYFEVRETEEDTSAPCEFSYGEDGIRGAIVMDKYGQAVISIETEARHPMPEMKVNEKTISLTEDFDDKNINVRSSDDRATVRITADDNVPVNVVLPNGKALSVTVRGNSYEYSLDGIEKKYIPEVSYTGYFARYEHEFKPNPKDDFSPEIDNIQLSLPGEGTDIIEIAITITHTPMTEDETDENDNGEQNGEPSYTHRAEFTVADDSETVADDSEISDPVILNAGDALTLKDVQGARISLLLDEKGNLKLQCHNILKGAANEDLAPEVKVNGKEDTENIEYVKSVTLARQDHSAKTVMIKINSVDNLNAAPIQNDHIKIDDPTPVPTPEPGKGLIEINKVDMETGEPLSGAEFGIWSLAEPGICNSDDLIYKGKTDEEGKITVTVDYGTYFYREIKAPENYEIDEEFYEITVTNSLMATQAISVNKRKTPIMPAEEPTQVEKKKVIKEKPVVTEHVDEVPRTGDSSNLILFLSLLIVSIGGFLVSFVDLWRRFKIK